MMTINKLIFLATFLLFFCIQMCFAQLPGGLKHIYFFGAGYTDIGNYAGCGTYFDPSSPITNSIAGKETGTAKATWAEYLSNKYGLHAVAGSVSSPGGNDWAVAHSVSGPPSSSKMYTANLYDEIGGFIAHNNPTPTATSLYVIWIQQNDVLQYMYNFLASHPNPSSAEQQTLLQGEDKIFMRKFSDLIYSITVLYDKMGARNFLIISDFRIDYAPLVANSNAQILPSFSSSKSVITSFFNHWEQALYSHDVTYTTGALEVLAEGLPSISIYTYKTGSFLQNLTQNPGKYGFPDTIAVAEGLLPADNYNNNKLEWILAKQGLYGKSFHDPDQFIFYDATHLTTHAYMALASDIYANSTKFTP